MSFARRSRFLSAGAALCALALAACSGGGSSSPQSALPAAQSPNLASGSSPVSAAAQRTISAPLSATSSTYSLPLNNGYTGTLSLHATGVPAGTNLVIGAKQPQTGAASTSTSGGGMHAAWGGRSHDCPSTITIPLYNPFRFPITLHVDGFSIGLPCSVDGTLFGVSFYQVEPVPAMVTSLKVGDITASGHKITFTSDVATITLPARTETALTIAPEDSTSEVAIPITPNSSTLLTSNPPPSITSTLSFAFSSFGGGGSLFSSACFPAYSDGVLNPFLAAAVIEGTPSYFCQLGTVDSATILFGAPSVTFTIGAPIPDRSFIGLDGAAGEYLCTPSGTTTCTTPEFTVPSVQNVIVGNVEDLQLCVPVHSTVSCNSNGNTATPAPSASSVPHKKELSLLVADDSTYKAVPGTCTAPAICGGFIVDTSAGSCVIDNDPDENGDVPPGYTDPGGPQESPPVRSGTSTHAYFPAVGPYTEIDLIAGAPWTTCSVTVTESDGPLLRSASLSVPVN